MTNEKGEDGKLDHTRYPGYVVHVCLDDSRGNYYLFGLLLVVHIWQRQAIILFRHLHCLSVLGEVEPTNARVSKELQTWTF
jgi:hypothetical protein